jgi:hypothetical protein
MRGGDLVDARLKPDLDVFTLLVRLDLELAGDTLLEFDDDFRAIHGLVLGVGHLALDHPGRLRERRHCQADYRRDHTSHHPMTAIHGAHHLSILHGKVVKTLVPVESTPDSALKRAAGRRAAPRVSRAGS